MHQCMDAKDVQKSEFVYDLYITFWEWIIPRVLYGYTTSQKTWRPIFYTNLIEIVELVFCKNLKQTFEEFLPKNGVDLKMFSK